ncbi:MAG: hypothetical protein ABIU77_07350 [Ferruginibacter sp.]|jgi:hypothetical protein
MNEKLNNSFALKNEIFAVGCNNPKSSITKAETTMHKSSTKLLASNGPFSLLA